jgi:hypothetical protein
MRERRAACCDNDIRHAHGNVQKAAESMSMVPGSLVVLSQFDDPDACQKNCVCGAIAGTGAAHHRWTSMTYVLLKDPEKKIR